MKPTDVALAKANEDALAKLRAERAAMDARLAAAYAGEESSKPKAAGEKPAQKYSMRGD
jgi:hypothetical protein